MTEAAHHALALEQCALFVDSPPLAKAMTDAAAFLRQLPPDPPREGQHPSNVYYERGFDDGFSDGANAERAKAQKLADAVREYLEALQPGARPARLSLALTVWERDDD